MAAHNYRMCQRDPISLRLYRYYIEGCANYFHYIQCKLIEDKIEDNRFLTSHAMRSILFVHSTKNEGHHSFELEKSWSPEFADCWTACSRQEGVQLIRKLKPQIVVLELNLAEGLDFDVFEQTRDVEYQKILLCDTGNYRLKLLRFDIDALILKPARWVDIKSVVEKLLFRTKRYKIQQLYNHRKAHSLATLQHAFVQTVDGQASIELRELVRLQDSGELRRLFLQNGKVVETAWSMKRLLSMLVGNCFVRLSAEEAVNCKHIEKLQILSERMHVVMPDGHTLRVPNSKECCILKGMRRES